MNDHRLPDDLTFCMVGERPIFLDLKGDRYFQLTGQAERAFLSWKSLDAVTHDDLAILIDRGILTPTESSSTRPVRSVPHARLSALESSGTGAKFGIGVFLEVFALVYLTQIQLKTIGFKATATRAHDRPHDPAIGTEGLDLRRATEAARGFLLARKLVPLNTCCLLDSLAMASFLRRRKLSVDVVIGVTADPFTAHCWVQAADLVLNDAIGNVRIYAPIRVL